MVSKHHTGRRTVATVALSLPLAFGFAGTAFAAPSNTHGHSADAPGQVKQQSSSDHSQGTAGTSGTSNQPQPVSGADQNSGGANGQCPGGPYCSTRDGSPSGNGKGGGKATGKPCAGCVGKADNKNPPGQAPNGSDSNNGYECDGNHGIGRTNPAHTGCTSSPPPTCEQTDSCPPPPPTCEETNSCKCPTDDTACQPCNKDCTPPKSHHHKHPRLGPPVQILNPPPPTLVLGESFSRVPQQLPFTGLELTKLLELALMVSSSGLAFFLWGSRKRHPVSNRTLS